MSLQQCDQALLVGYKPYFVNSLPILSALYSGTNLCWTPTKLEEAVRRHIDDFLVKEDDITTSDNYTWLCGLRFHCGTVEVCVAIPKCNDLYRLDCCRQDRSIAIYIMTEIAKDSTQEQYLQAWMRELVNDLAMAMLKKLLYEYNLFANMAAANTAMQEGLPVNSARAVQFFMRDSGCL